MRRFKRLRGIDIEKGSVALDRDFRHCLAMLRNQMAGADIAVERHQLVEEAARPQHRIAAPAVAHRHRNQVAAIRREGLDQPVDQVRIATDEDWPVAIANALRGLGLTS